jgi:hypothetical protein
MAAVCLQMAGARRLMLETCPQMAGSGPSTLAACLPIP